MNKDQKTLIIIIAIIAVFATAFGIYAFKHNKKENCRIKETDAVKFKKEYEEYNGKKYDNSDIEYFTVKLSNKNLFKYVSSKKAIDIMENGTGIIYFGFPQCPWCRTLVPYLEETAKVNGISEIYYLNILELRDSYKVENKKVVTDKKGTKEYYEILKLLDKHLEKFYVTDDSGKKYDTGVKRLYAPTTVVVKNGKIVAFHQGTVDSQAKFVPLTEKEQDELKKVLNEKISLISNTVCTDKGC